MSEINFTTTDAEKIYNTILSGFENNLNEPLYPGDERRLFVENGIIPVMVVLFNKMNDAAKQRLLKYAAGPVLDALGERVYCARLQPNPAKCTLQFTLGTTRGGDIVIPKGTRATADGAVYFAVDEPAIIKAGELSVTAEATATVGGTAGNNYAIGAIATIVDAVPFVSGVTNLTETTGGDAGEPYPEEDGGAGDNLYRERIKIAVTAVSTAGSEIAYKYHVLSVSSQIADVRVLSNQQAGTVNIYAVGANGEDLPETVIAAIIEKLNRKEIRPLGDLVQVAKPEAVPFDIELKYYVSYDAEAEAIKNIEGAGGAIEQYITWQQSAIGRDINPDKLRLLCLRPGDNLTGCYRIEITSPDFQTLADDQIARWSGKLTASHAVVEE